MKSKKSKKHNLPKVLYAFNFGGKKHSDMVAYDNFIGMFDQGQKIGRYELVEVGTIQTEFKAKT